MSDDKLREAAENLVRIMVTRRHSDLCQQGGDCAICDAMSDINAALADSAKSTPWFREYGTVSEDVMRELRLDPSKHEFPDTLLQRLPKILRLGAGDETSLATKLMRAAADEIDNLRATADVHQIPDKRCPMCVGILAKAVDEGADGTPVESANDYLDHGGHFMGCSKFRLPPTADAPPEVTEEMVEVKQSRIEGWEVLLNRELISYHRYESAANLLAIRLRAALAAAQKEVPSFSEAAQRGQWGLTIAEILMEIADATSDEKTATTLARLAGKIRAQCDAQMEK